MLKVLHSVILCVVRSFTQRSVYSSKYTMNLCYETLPVVIFTHTQGRGKLFFLICSSEQAVEKLLMLSAHAGL